MSIIVNLVKFETNLKMYTDFDKRVLHQAINTYIDI